MNYKMTEEECEEKIGHCWTTPIIRVCQHCGKEERGPRSLPHNYSGDREHCKICGRPFLFELWHRLTRGHFPVSKEAKR